MLHVLVQWKSSILILLITQINCSGQEDKIVIQMFKEVQCQKKFDYIDKVYFSFSRFVTVVNDICTA